MNADQLLSHYERIAEAPDAITRLRRFILDLAVRGKLVPQHLNDEPAGVEMQTASGTAARRARRRDVGPESSDAVSADDRPFPTPMGWSFVRLGQVLDMVNGRAFKPSDWIGQGLPIIRIQNLNNPDAPFNYCDPQTVDPRHLVHDGAFLISWSGTPGTSFGAFIWTRGPAALNQHIFRCVPAGKSFSAAFLRIAINSQLDVLISKAQGGVGLRHVTKGTLEALPLPLPPLAEQDRIVAKVEELMTLCDQLEAARKKREAMRNRLTTATLARLNTPVVETFQDDVRFALDALTAITTRPDQVKELRQTILNLAVRGKLVAQEPTDEPIKVTLRQALARRATLILEKKIRRKRVDAIDDLPLDEDLPTSWALERLGNLVDPANAISYGVLVPGDDVPDGVPFVRAQDLALSAHPERPNKTISPEIEKSYARTRLRGGEILMCVVGSIGKLGIVPRSWAGANIARAVARVSPIPEISREYLLIVLRGEPAQTYFRNATRTLAQPTLNVGLIEQTPIPLPPLAEQHRIVSKVDELMKICDRLEASLTAGETNRRRLLEALLNQALTQAEGEAA